MLASAMYLTQAGKLHFKKTHTHTHTSRHSVKFLFDNFLPLHFDFEDACHSDKIER